MKLNCINYDKLFVIKKLNDTRSIVLRTEKCLLDFFIWFLRPVKIISFILCRANPKVES